MSTLNVEFTPAQCRAARALIGMTQPNLADMAGVGLSTVVDFERDRREVSPATVSAIKRALEMAGVEFENLEEWVSVGAPMSVIASRR